MKKQKRIRNFGINIGRIQPGSLNSITDVPGVTVGHCTINEKDIKTGVTAVLPHQGNLFRDKVLAATHIINGFGKTVGTIQINELGTLETPILLTNTLSVGTAYNAVVDYMLERNLDIGVTTGTVNPVICECNDGEFLNDIRGRHVKKEHVLQALTNSGKEFEEGGYGAGTGMSCYKLKGGIGSSSRILMFNKKQYTVGVLVLANHGEKCDLSIDGNNIGKKICNIGNGYKMQGDKGSIITIIATDIPLSHNQLERLSRRAVIGIARTGAYMGNGSGEIVISFSTANRIRHYKNSNFIDLKMINPDKIDLVFRSAIEAVEEAILNALITANPTKGREGVREALSEYMGYFNF